MIKETRAVVIRAEPGRVFDGEDIGSSTLAGCDHQIGVKSRNLSHVPALQERQVSHHDHDRIASVLCQLGEILV